MSPSMGGQFQFHLTSLNLKNPANAPDAFEREALLTLISRQQSQLSDYGEYTEFLQTNDTSVFRYFAPLYTKESCLSCHGDQGLSGG
ncbi:MAG TPA: DUF3365 domain-containing protein [bacterium]|nr:DUF3365 domain-containing protein [bacterium]